MKINVFATAVAIGFGGVAAIADGVPAGGPIRMTMPTRMVKDNTLTLKAEILDQYGPFGRIDWRQWNQLGTVAARRTSNGAVIPTTITIFENYAKGAGGGTPPPDSIRFYNGVGTVSFYFDDPSSLSNGEQVEISVTAIGKTATKTVTVLDNAPETFKALSGTLSGANLTWGPADGVIHLTGDVTVPAGSTLTISAGTLVMADKGTPQNGVVIDVLGSVSAQGTAEDPIFFFASEGAAALELVAGNTYAWQGIYHDGANTSTYAHVVFTGGGNGQVGTYHLYPPMLRFFNSHSLQMSDCVLTDSAASAIVVDYGSGTVAVARSAIIRVGIGGKFGVNYEARCHTAVTFEDTWFARIGRGVEVLELDGDALHWDSDSPQGLTLRRCILTDIGDDCVDGTDTFYVKTIFEDCIAYDLDDKLTTYWPGDAMASNLLLFAANKGFESVNGYPTQSTLADQHSFPWEFGGDWWVNNSIAAPYGTDDLPGETYSCTRFHANYTLLANSAHISCGTANVVGDALFVNPMTGGFPPTPADYQSSYDYNLQPGSPALTAGPNGERVGWLGFPRAEPCSTDAECGSGGTYDDGNPCTVDACVVRVCNHELEPGCIACMTSRDCDYGDETVTGMCEAGGICSFTSAGCTVDADCDDGFFCNGNEVCTGGVCGGGNAVDCSALSDQCNTGVCDELLDTCLRDAMPHEGNPCDDGLACTDGSVCVSGACGAGTSVDCSYLDDACNVGVCSEAVGGCEAQAEIDGTACDDIVFCNGAEVCQGGVCIAGDAPCSNACEACDESGGACAWCILDLDGNEWIASGDFGGFAGCYGQCYPAGDHCNAANFDGSADGCVGSGDFGGFAGCYGLGCGECSNCFPGAIASANDSRARQAREQGALISLVAVELPTAGDSAAVLPVSRATTVVGEVVLLEIWASAGNLCEELAAVYVDVVVDPEKLALESVIPSETYSLFVHGAMNSAGGTVRGLGGCTRLGGRQLGERLEWTRVATLRVRGRAVGDVPVEIALPASGAYGIALKGRLGDLNTTEVGMSATVLHLTAKGGRRHAR